MLRRKIRIHSKTINKQQCIWGIRRKFVACTKKEKRQLTTKPPPMIPPMYFTSSVMCPSLAYLMFQPGKNKMMLQMIDRSSNGYRAPAMQRAHFAVHMLSEGEKRATAVKNTQKRQFSLQSFLFSEKRNTPRPEKRNVFALQMLMMLNGVGDVTKR